jgi:hypothetical protein
MPLPHPLRTPTRPWWRTRAGLSPSQLVEQKVLYALKAHPVLASQFHRRLRPGPR